MNKLQTPAAAAAAAAAPAAAAAVVVNDISDEFSGLITLL